MNYKPPNILKKKTKGLLVKNKIQSAVWRFDSIFDILEALRSGALSLQDLYYNEAKNSWQEINNLPLLKKRNIPISKESINRVYFEVDISPPKIPIVNKKERYIFAN